MPKGCLVAEFFLSLKVKVKREEIFTSTVLVQVQLKSGGKNGRKNGRWERGRDIRLYTVNLSISQSARVITITSRSPEKETPLLPSVQGVGNGLHIIISIGHS